MRLESLIFRDRFDRLLEKRLSGVAELGYTMLYGKSQVEFGAKISVSLVNGFSFVDAHQLGQLQ